MDDAIFVIVETQCIASLRIHNCERIRLHIYTRAQLLTM